VTYEQEREQHRVVAAVVRGARCLVPVSAPSTMARPRVFSSHSRSAMIVRIERRQKIEHRDISRCLAALALSDMEDPRKATHSLETIEIHLEHAPMAADDRYAIRCAILDCSYLRARGRPKRERERR